MEAIGAFILKYWLEFVFGIIILALTALARHYHTLIKTGRETKKEREMAPIMSSIETCQKEMNDKLSALSETVNSLQSDIARIQTTNNEQNDKIDAIKGGTLALWRKTYFHDARKLLEPDHIITQEEFMKISVEHKIYNDLGGNHEGDEYFKSIQQKYNSGLKNG